jgi:hypothetical protein
MWRIEAQGFTTSAWLSLNGTARIIAATASDLTQEDGFLSKTGRA